MLRWVVIERVWVWDEGRKGTGLGEGPNLV